MQVIDEKSKYPDEVETRRLQGEDLVEFYRKVYPQYRGRDYRFETIGDHDYLIFSKEQ
jgi:hypothetical protein